MIRFLCNEYVRFFEDIETIVLYVTRPAGRGTRWS